MSITPEIKTKADTQQSSAETTSLRKQLALANKRAERAEQRATLWKEKALALQRKDELLIVEQVAQLLGDIHPHQVRFLLDRHGVKFTTTPNRRCRLYRRSAILKFKRGMDAERQPKD